MESSKGTKSEGRPTDGGRSSDKTGGCGEPCTDSMLPVVEAREIVLARTKAVQEIERLPIRQALGRVLAADLFAPADVPAHTNSAVDGFAVRSADLSATEPRSFECVGHAYAGRAFEATVGEGQCVLVTTGAVIPRGCDTAVMKEHAEVSEGRVTVRPGIRAFSNVRMAGEDLRAGEKALGRGHALRPADIGLAASLGVSEVGVRRRPRVAFFSTGDELRSVGEALRAGEVYDSNRYTIYGMLERLGVESIDLGVVRDERQALRDALQRASEEADVVITTGGVSVGEADYIKEILEDLGRIDFWRIAIKPGRPLVYGQLGDTHFFGLPGNPVAVMVTFYQVVQPALRKMMGLGELLPPRLSARSTSALRKLPKRLEVKRGILSRNADGELEVEVTGQQGSGILSSMTRANCFIVLPPERESVAAGEWVEVERFVDFV